MLRLHWWFAGCWLALAALINQKEDFLNLCRHLEQVVVLLKVQPPAQYAPLKSTFCVL